MWSATLPAFRGRYSCQAGNPRLELQRCSRNLPESMQSKSPSLHLPCCSLRRSPCGTCQTVAKAPRVVTLILPQFSRPHSSKSPVSEPRSVARETELPPRERARASVGIAEVFHCLHDTLFCWR